mgnify:CR=1 FL=1
MNFRKSFILSVIVLMTMSCHQNEVFFQYKNVSQQEWSKDSVMKFDVHISNKEIPHNFYIHLRHNGNYPYQNIWLFLQQTNPDKSVKKDSVEVYLADQYGKWLGTGTGNLKEMQIFYQNKFLFPDTGTYHFEITHGMRDSLLQGIKDVGVRIEKTK